MISGRLLTAFLALTLLAGANAQADGFSVKEWSKELSLASGTGQKARIAALTDLAGIAKKALRSGEGSVEKETLLKARRLFAAGKFTEAIAAYDQIPRGSDRWLEAVEEKGWAFHRQDQFEKALSQTKTLLTGPFVGIVGSEPFFLQTLSMLKICDYKGILETNKLYKETQRERVVALQGLANTGKSEAVTSLIEKADRFPLQLEEIGTEAKRLPRLFFRDLAVQEALMEIKMAQAPAARGLAKIQKAGQLASARLAKRLQQLARAENQENFKMLQKLNLIEVETIQRVHADLRNDPNAYKKGQFAQADPDDLVFPDDGNPWMDELDKYQTRVNSCPRNVRRKM